MAEIESLVHLAEQFGRLSGIGRKSAMRMAYSVLEFSDEEAAEFAKAIVDAKTKIHYCPICQNLTDRDVCYVCNDMDRDTSVICVVEDARAVMSLEKVREYRGLYHVLHGVISPVNGITPEQLKLKELLARIDENVKEIIVATNPTVEGEATANYIAELCAQYDVEASRIAHGVPVGGELEMVDGTTLSHSLAGRHKIRF